MTFEERKEKITHTFNTLVSHGRTLNKALEILVVDEDEQWAVEHNAIVFKLAWEYRLNARLGAK